MGTLNEIYRKYCEYMDAYRRRCGVVSETLSLELFAARWEKLDTSSRNAAIKRFNTDFDSLLKQGRQRVAEVVRHFQTPELAH